MAIKYKVQHRRSQVSGKHYASLAAVSNGRISLSDLCEDVASKSHMEAHEIRGVMERLASRAQILLSRGFRVEFGPVTIFPKLSGTLTDTETHAATADDLSVVKAKTTLGATVSRKFTRDFAEGCNWQRVDE